MILPKQKSRVSTREFSPQKIRVKHKTLLQTVLLSSITMYNPESMCGFPDHVVPSMAMLQRCCYLFLAVSRLISRK